MSDWERETIPSRLLCAETLEGIRKEKGCNSGQVPAACMQEYQLRNGSFCWWSANLP